MKEYENSNLNKENKRLMELVKPNWILFHLYNFIIAFESMMAFLESRYKI